MKELGKKDNEKELDFGLCPCFSYLDGDFHKPGTVSETGAGEDAKEADESEADCPCMVTSLHYWVGFSLAWQHTQEYANI